MRIARWMWCIRGITRDYPRPRFLAGVASVVTITFPDRETLKQALGFMIGRFSGRVFRSGEVIVPEEALAALSAENISFAVLPNATVPQSRKVIRYGPPEIE